MASAPQNQVDRRPSSITVDVFTRISSKYLGDGAILPVLAIDLRVIIRLILDVVIDAMIFIFFPRISRETPLSFRMSLNLRSTEDTTGSATRTERGRAAQRADLR